MKKLPGEVYLFVIIWLLFAPALSVYFAARIIYVNVEHIDPATVANFAFVWPVAVIVVLTIFLLTELAAYFKYKMGFFSAWHEIFRASVGR